jgi:hypothetical protein
MANFSEVLGVAMLPSAIAELCQRAKVPPSASNHNGFAKSLGLPTQARCQSWWYAVLRATLACAQDEEVAEGAQADQFFQRQATFCE